MPGESWIASRASSARAVGLVSGRHRTALTSFPDDQRPEGVTHAARCPVRRRKPAPPVRFVVLAMVLVFVLAILLPFPAPDQEDLV